MVSLLLASKLSTCLQMANKWARSNHPQGDQTEALDIPFPIGFQKAVMELPGDCWPPRACPLQVSGRWFTLDKPGMSVEG
jgi:hypothetical protein